MAQPELKSQIFSEIIRYQLKAILMAPILYYLIDGYWLYKQHFLLISSPLPSFSTMLWQIIVFIFAEDAIFFWTHYLVHHRYLYPIFHKHHHSFRQPIGFISVLADPLESATQNQISIWLLPILLPYPKHMVTLLLFIAIRVYQTCNAHAGYEIPWISPRWYLPGICTGAVGHDYHHKYNMQNYGSFFTFWDRFMNTYQPVTL